MAEAPVFDASRREVGKVDLPDEIFAGPVNEALLYDIVKAQLASRRVGSAKTKTRSEVAGSTRKVYKQKGTGRARHGSIRAPIYVGGGKAHGPTPRDYSFRPPRKMREAALRSALSLKVKEGCLTVVDKLELEKPKTREVVALLNRLKAVGGTLFVDGAGDAGFAKSIKNLPGDDLILSRGINVYDILRHRNLILTKQVVEDLSARLTAKPGRRGKGVSSDSSDTESANAA